MKWLAADIRPKLCEIAITGECKESLHDSKVPVVRLNLKPLSECDLESVAYRLEKARQNPSRIFKLNVSFQTSIPQICF